MRRKTPYVRKPPPPNEHHWRKAWVGSVSLYDAAGNELHTWRYAAEADADPTGLADRVAADVGYLLRQRPDLPVQVIQDGAPELRALPEALEGTLPTTANMRRLIDFDHLTSNYLDAVVDACEPPGDPYNMKGWYRGELLRDDKAIDRIWRALRERAKRLPASDTEARKAVAAALSYIRHRKHMMRYSSSYTANLAIGSGATETTCWTMQRRVKRPAQSWEFPGSAALSLYEPWCCPNAGIPPGKPTLRPIAKESRPSPDQDRIHLGLNNGRIEGLNGKARVITRRAFGFHSASALIAMLFLCCGGIAASPAHIFPFWTH